MALIISVAEIGKVRSNMEDYVYPAPGTHMTVSPPFAAIVADGVAGSPYGERASQAAVEIAMAYFKDMMDRGVSPSLQLIKAIFDKVQEALIFLQEADPSMRGASTTMSMAIFDDSTAYIGYAGDSPIFLIRGPRIRRIDEPHVVGTWVYSEGSLVLNTTLVNCMGGYPGIYAGPGKHECSLKKGDIVFLSSDGVTLHVSPEEIRDAFLEKSPREAVQHIKHLVYERGAFDNFSFVVVVWE